MDASLYETKTDIPVLGLRNYWYPAIATWRVRKKPKAISLLGEKIVLFRDNGKISALADRCSHRGAPLSMGKCLYPGSGTVSCPYHGWTFDGATGKLVAKLMEGSETPLSARAAVPTPFTNTPASSGYSSVIWNTCRSRRIFRSVLRTGRNGSRSATGEPITAIGGC